MIVRDKPTVWELLFAVRGSVVGVVAPRVAFFVVASTAMVALHQQLKLFPEVDGFGLAIFGIALSLFLGFRNNAAYDRWWEARRLWGGLLADARNLARDVRIFVSDEAVRQALLRLALTFMHQHRAQLRGIANDPQAAEWSAGLLGKPTSTGGALDHMAELLAEAHFQGAIDGFGARALTERMASMALQQAGNERIANTPLPYAYSLAIYRTTYIYCLLLPLALVGPAGWLTPLFVGMVAYMFLGLAEVSEELSQPFGTTPNGLALDAICRAAEISLVPHLGMAPPPPLEPRLYVLS